MWQPVILVAIGANLPSAMGGTAMDTCEWAVGRLAALPGLKLLARSHWFRSSPVPPSAQPDYINGVVRLSGVADPVALLACLHGIEAEAGRTRGAPNAARTLDLDLLAVGAVVLDTPGLVLPHPRLHERGFVLAPLTEVAPGWRHPVSGRGVEELLASCGQAGLARLPCPPRRSRSP